MSDVLDINKIKNFLEKFAAERNWKQFHNPKNLSMALTVEASELLEIFQWMTPENSLKAHLDPAIKEQVSHELADIMLYLIQIALVMDINLEAAIQDKILINKEKYPVFLT